MLQQDEPLIICRIEGKKVEDVQVVTDLLRIEFLSDAFTSRFLKSSHNGGWLCSVNIYKLEKY